MAEHAASPLTEASIAERVEELLAQLTVAEKAGQLTQYFYFPDGAGPNVDHQESAELLSAVPGGAAKPSATVDAALGRGEVGSMLFVTDPAEINRLQRLAVEGHRLGIPALFGFDVIHGLRTIFPVPIAMAASWDPATIEAGQAVAAREARAVGIHWSFAPMLDIARDPRWGRIVEGAGEDPYLGSAVGAAQVKGFQGPAIGTPERVIAGPKHLVGYGASLGGRDYDEVNLSDYELWNVYLPPFAAAVAAGAGNIMTAYMDLNGIPAAGNRWLVEEVLRGTWGFEGFVVSDAQAVHNLYTQHYAPSLTDAGVRGLKTGVDLEMAVTDPAYAHLPEALAAGTITEADLDVSVRRVLTAKARLGLLDDPYVDEDRSREVLADPAHRDQARVAAEKAAVLLRNEPVAGGQGGLLPLKADDLGRIALIGPLADSPRDTIGPWVFDFDLDETVTIRKGLTAYAGDKVSYAPGLRPDHRTYASMFDMFPGNSPVDPEDFDDDAELERAIDLAAGADVAVVVLGEFQNMIGEGASRASLELPGHQLDLLKAVVATGTPVVLLLMNGRPLDLRWASKNVPAILDIWYPGTSGGAAVANLLFGYVAPGGKLPFSWPRSVGQVPLIYNHTTSHDPTKQWRRYWDEESTPLFPFGFGLSYGEIEYSALTLSSEAIEVDGSVTVTVEVANVGAAAAEEVVQLYLHQRYGTASRPVRELKGFERISLAAGESRSVQLTLGPDELRYWNAGVKDWVVDVTEFDVWVGGSSSAELAATFATTG